MKASILALAASGLLVTFAARPASARCSKEQPIDPACEPLVSMLMPSAAGVVFVPHDAGGAYVGGGIEIAFLSWSSNSDSFGPSHGRFRGNVSYLAGDLDRRLLLYRFGGVVSFEGNASRRFFIPTFGASLGGLWESKLGDRTIADASLGMYFVYTRRFVLDGEGGIVVPLTDTEKLIGPRAQLTASFALW